MSKFEFAGLKVSLGSKSEFPAVVAYDHNFTEADKQEEVKDDLSLRSTEVAQMEDIQRLIDSPEAWEDDLVDQLLEKG